MLLAGIVVIGSLAAWIGTDAVGASAPGPPPSSIGTVENRPVPAAIANLAFQDQTGHQITLRSLRHRAVLLVPFLTSCQEECPIATGALLAMQQALRADHLNHKAVLAEVTVDPQRDTPARLAAYAHLVGSHFPLLTASSATIHQFWKYFGIWYQRVPEDSPPGIDWQTHQPYTYDVNHSDGFIVLGPGLRERFFAGGMTKVTGLPPRLGKLLDDEGRSNLRHPGGGAWTVQDGLNALGWVLGRPVATTG